MSKTEGHETICLTSNDVYLNLKSKMPLTDETAENCSNEANLKEIRQNWANRFEFLLACIGYSVGLGNVWRFGYLCSKSGGGAFLIPYFINLIIVAIPLMYMEFSVGQFTQKGPIGSLKQLCPLFKGAGVATVVISFFLTTYYIVIITWAMYFILSSFTTELPWRNCDNSWNTADCWDGISIGKQFISNFTNNSHTSSPRTPSEEFFKIRLLNESESFENFGTPRMDLLVFVVIAWMIVYFCIWRGVKSTGKIVYVTALFPYLILVLFLIRGVSLDGAMIGIKYFFIPKWEKLLESKVWAYAAIQNFNSIGVAFGGLISMSSFNKQNKPIFGNVLAIASVDAVTSLICGTTVFSVLGYIAKTQSKEIDDIIEQGPGLVFMVLPEAIRNMSFSPVWAFLFFLMIFMLGIDSQFTMVETVVTTIEDEFEFFFKKYLKRKEWLALIVCLFTFFLCLPCICPGGIYYFTIIDSFSAGISVFYIAFFETIAITWIYGAKKLANNVEAMNGKRPSKLIIMCWYFVSPVFILIIWIFSWIQYTPISYGKKQFSSGAITLGWCIALVSIIAIPAGAIHTLINSSEKKFSNKLKSSLLPTIPDFAKTSNSRIENHSNLKNSKENQCQDSASC